ncbi:MAG: sulfate reduction electron transfer complex DsrMKJOP subunit DsrO [Desulfohalobiaceae bacterium]
MHNNRRKFLQLAGITAALSLCGGSLHSALRPKAERHKDRKDALKAKRWGMLIDTKQFQTQEDFQKVIRACHSVHNVPQDLPNSKQEIKWIWTEVFHHLFPSQENPYLAHEMEEKQFLTLCNHCDDPPCVRVCPTKATFKREDGIVMMDFHRCIGCRYCMAGCPYGSRSFNFFEPRQYVNDLNPEYPTRTRGVVEKCTFCVDRLDQGEMPACVEASNGAIIFGDLEDPESEIRKKLQEQYTLRRKVQLGTNPCVYYLV